VAITIAVRHGLVAVVLQVALAGAVLAWIYKREMGVTTAPVSRV
jgi:hypothetical protein